MGRSRRGRRTRRRARDRAPRRARGAARSGAPAHAPPAVRGGRAARGVKQRRARAADIPTRLNRETAAGAHAARTHARTHAAPDMRALCVALLVVVARKICFECAGDAVCSEGCTHRRAPPVVPHSTYIHTYPPCARVARFFANLFHSRTIVSREYYIHTVLQANI